MPDTPLDQAKRWAAEYLKRPHSEKETRDRLREKNVAPHDIETVIALCLDYGFLNDADYAGMIVRHYAGRGYGPGRIRAELQRRGVPRALWAEALAGIGDQSDDIDRLLAMRMRGRDPADRKEREKAAAALVRRGWSWEEVRAALRRYGQSDDDIDDI